MAFHIVEENPDVRLPYLYLIDNLLADHRANEAENYLERVNRLPDARPVMVQVYQAHIALARFDEKTADRIIENLVAAHPDDFVCLFEAAQYYAQKNAIIPKRLNSMSGLSKKRHADRASVMN